MFGENCELVYVMLLGWVVMCVCLFVGVGGFVFVCVWLCVFVCVCVCVFWCVCVGVCV